MLSMNMAQSVRRAAFSKTLSRSLAMQSAVRLQDVTSNKKLIQWVDEKAKLLKPDNVRIVTGTPEEQAAILSDLVKKGVIEQLNPKLRPNSYLCRTDPADVARAEQSTYICSDTKAEAGPTNNWVEPDEMRKTLNKNFDGAMKGRDMYVIPYSMGPVGSPLSRIGVELTDSAFVVANMNIMTRTGTKVLKALGNDDFVPCVHSIGRPLKAGEKDVAWPCNIPERKIVHFPKTREIWSFGSGYGGNSLLGKKCFALRIASNIARDEGWFAEHMLILTLTNPQGKKYNVVAAFPSACGKTNLAMLQPSIPGWKVECVGDDISWMRFGKDQRLYAINPESGFFGVAPGTSNTTNKNAMDTIKSNTIFTNVAKTPEGDIWWEGLSKPAPPHLTSWLNEPWTPSSSQPAAHPNSRFTVAASQCPSISPDFENPNGVPIDAIIFGGRRPANVPLVYQSFNWQHGTFIGSSVASQMTAAAEGKVGELRFDSFAMLPFCGYNMADYFAHWLKMGASSTPDKLPKIFHVNWFRQDNGKFLWPGFSENSRVLKWITERIEGKENANKTAIGYVPKPDAIDTKGLDISPATMNELLKVDNQRWLAETNEIEKYYTQFGNTLPKGIKDELAALRQRLQQA